LKLGFGIRNPAVHLKNRSGWTGRSTQDLKRTDDRFVALILNRWSIFTRIGSEGKHGEVITTRPLLMQEYLLFQAT